MKYIIAAIFGAGLIFSCQKPGTSVNTDQYLGSKLVASNAIVSIDWSSTNNDTLRETLRTALRNANPGDTIQIPDGKQIYFNACDTGLLISANNVTLLGSQTPVRYGAGGALITRDVSCKYPLIRVSGNDVKIIGLRLRGPDPTGDYASDQQENHAIACVGDNLKINYCEMWGWSEACITLTDSFPARSSSYLAKRLFSNGADQARITYSFMHDNFKYRPDNSVCGYGIGLKKGTNAIIRYCKFNNNLHSITANGNPGNSYNASFDSIGAYPRSFAFDVHGTGPGGNGGTGGDSISITNNVFQIPAGTYSFNGNSTNNIYAFGVRIRGAQIHLLRVKNNKFCQPHSQAISFYPGMYALIPVKDTTANTYNLCN